MAGKYSKLFRPYVAHGKNDKGYYDISADESLKYFDDKVPEGEEWEALKDMGIDLNLPSSWHGTSTYFLTDNVLPFVTPHEKDLGKSAWFDEDNRRIPQNIWYDFNNHNGKFSAEDFEKNGITPEARRNIFKQLVLDARNNANNLTNYDNRKDKSVNFLDYGTGMRWSIGDAIEHRKYLDKLDTDNDDDVDKTDVSNIAKSIAAYDVGRTFDDD